MRRHGPSGQMTINMKTTITTSGAHSGYIVNSGIQAGAKQLHRQQYASDWSLPSGPTVESPGGSRQITNGSHSPYPRIQPSTSHESLNQNYSRVPDSTNAWSRRIPSYEELPPQSTFSSSNRPNDFSTNVRRYPSYEEIPRTEIVTRPRTPPSPIELFKGRESPPEEFIRPSHITLNTFNADGHPSRSPISYGLKKAEDPRSTDALIHDSVMTTTTVEVFRTPLDGRDSALLSAPPGLDDRPQLLRLNGPPYEKWTSHKTETLINDRPVYTPSASRVQWKEDLVDERDRDLYPESRSPYEHTIIPKRSPSTEYIPTVHHVDPRLYQDYGATPGIQMHQSTSPYMVQSPSEMSHSLQNLQRISPLPPQRTSSRPNSALYRDVSPSPSYSQLAYGDNPRYQQPPPLVIDNPAMNQVPASKQLSPVYVVPDRVRTAPSAQRRYEELTGDGYSTIDRELEHEHRNHDSGRHRTRDGYSMIERKRSQSHHRGSRRSPRDYERTRSMSPTKRRSSHVPEDDRRRDRNQEPVEELRARESQEPRTASTREIFRLYQTRDAFDNVVAQFDELDFGLSDGIMLTSPLAESEESLISVLSNRNDRAKSDYLELRPAPPLDRDLIMEQVERSKRLGEQQLYEEPDCRMKPDNKESLMNEENENEMKQDHIYEDLETLRPAVLTKPSSPQYAEIRENRGINLSNRPITQELQDFVKSGTPQHANRANVQPHSGDSSLRAATAEVSRAELACLSLEAQKKVVTTYDESDIVDTSASMESLNDWPAPPASNTETRIPPPPPLITLPQLPPSPAASISLSRSSSGSSISSDLTNFSNSLPLPNLVQLPAPPCSKPSIRKAHPDGLTFPKVASVPMLPDLPEETASARASSTNSSIVIVPDWPLADERQDNDTDRENIKEGVQQSNEHTMIGNNSLAIVTADDYKLKIENYQHLFAYPNESSV